MTIVTPIRPWYRLGGSLLVRTVFRFARYVTRTPGAIQELSFIHFARWGLIERFPDFGQPAEQLRQPLFMFETNYNGSFDQYIDAFSNVLTSGMTLFWGTSYGFPGPKPVTRFETYIHANEYLAGHYHSAYPGASATMISAALPLREQYLDLRAKANNAISPDVFAKEYTSLVRALQGNPVSVPASSPSIAQKFLERVAGLKALLGLPGKGNRSGHSYAITSLVPIKRDQVEKLRAFLDGLSGSVSPFAGVPSVHFARLLIVDQMRLDWPHAPSPATELQSAYLLLTAAVTAPEGTIETYPSAFFGDLAALIPETVESLWGGCYGYPGIDLAENFVTYLEQSELATVLFYVGYPDADVATVHSALSISAWLRGFAITQQGNDRKTLMAAFLTEGPTT